MVNNEDIDFDKTIRQKKLIIRNIFKYYLNESINYLLAIVLAILLFRFAFDVRIANIDPVERVIFAVFLVVFTLVIYRKFNERKFLLLSTNLTVNNTRRIIREFAKSKNWELQESSNNYSLYMELKGEYFFEPPKRYLFIHEDSRIFFIVLNKPFYKGTLPVITAHLHLKSELKEFIAKWKV